MAEQERAEILVIEEFLPTQLSDDEIQNAVNGAITQTGAESLKDMGKVMGALKGKYAGQMDFGKAGGLVKQQLRLISSASPFVYYLSPRVAGTAIRPLMWPMAFPSGFLDEIKNRVAVSDVVARKVKLQRRGREFVGLSPFKQNAHHLSRSMVTSSFIIVFQPVSTARCLTL